MGKYVPIAIFSIAAVAFGTWVMYDHNWKFGTAQVIVGIAAAWATAAGKATVDDTP
jgi:hypothetical protein